MLYEYLFQPFVEFGFMRRALVASLALAVGGSSIGVFLIRFTRDTPPQHNSACKTPTRSKPAPPGGRWC